MKPVKLAYEVLYPNNGADRNLPPIILLHGLLETRKTWRVLAPKIAEETGRIVYMYDSRNHGESEWSDQFNYDIFAEDLEKFMDDRKIPKAILIGHSMGGKAAITLALKKPHRVEKLIVEDVSPKNWTPSPNAIAHVLQSTQRLRESLNSIPEGADYYEAQKAITDYMTQFFGAKNESYPFDLSAISLKRRKDGSYTWQSNLDVIDDTTVHFERTLQKLSGVYEGDTLFIYGPKSPFEVHKDSLIPQLFPTSQMIPIEGAKHLLHKDYPEQFLRHVINFILFPQKVKSKY